MALGGLEGFTGCIQGTTMRALLLLCKSRVCGCSLRFNCSSYLSC